MVNVLIASIRLLAPEDDKMVHGFIGLAHRRRWSSPLALVKRLCAHSLRRMKPTLGSLLARARWAKLSPEQRIEQTKNMRKARSNAAKARRQKK